VKNARARPTTTVWLGGHREEPLRRAAGGVGGMYRGHCARAAPVGRRITKRERRAVVLSRRPRKIVAPAPAADRAYARTERGGNGNADTRSRNQIITGETTCVTGAYRVTRAAPDDSHGRYHCACVAWTRRRYDSIDGRVRPASDETRARRGRCPARYCYHKNGYPDDTCERRPCAYARFDIPNLRRSPTARRANGKR
jgi:hypothetical protein